MHLYSVTPESTQPAGAPTFRERLDTSAARCESAGLTGILVPHNMHEVDPWMVASYLGSVTDRLIPLLAVQPASTPPHTAAACAAAYAALYDRPLHINLVAGAREDELRGIGDGLGHDERYDRLREYGTILRSLLTGGTVDTDSTYYRYTRHRLVPCPEVLAQCRIFVAGSSPASLAAATGVADVVVTHPTPFAEWHDDFLAPLLAAGYAGELGIRIGILCRPDRAEAWRVAREQFPRSWIGRQETLLKTRSANSWSRELAVLAVAREAASDDESDPYWLGAFHSGLASTPFLVGTYADVAERLAHYMAAGVGHILLTGSRDDEFIHIQRGIRLATGG